MDVPIYFFSEILVEIEWEACPEDEAEAAFSSAFPCLESPSVRIAQWAIARLVQIDDGSWEYKIKTLEPTTSCSSSSLCGNGITQPVFIDLNQDGTQEMCYIEISYDHPTRYFKDWKCFETGNNVVQGGFGYKTIFSKSFDVDESDEQYFNQVSYEDYNGDGFIDLMFSKGDEDDSVWSVIYTNSFNGEFEIKENLVHETFVIAGRGEDENPHYTIDAFKLDKHLFIDVNNDGLKDSLLFKYDPNDSKIKVYKTLGTISGGDINSKDKIVSITQGLGKHIEIDYKPMSDTSVYTRENNSVNAWYGSGKTPVYDFISQMSLVSEHRIDLPAYDIAATDLSGTSISLPNMQQTYQYHYYGAKIQAGGRGFLGFKTFEEYDLNNNILSQSDYHQEFPFTGLTDKRLKYFVELGGSPASLRLANTDNKLIPCWVNGNCAPVIPPIDTCLRVSGIICIPQIFSQTFSSVPTGAKLISSIDNQWNKELIDTGIKTSIFLYPSVVATDQNELDGVSKIGRTLVATIYGESSTSFYGNPTKVIEYSYDKNSTSATLTKTTDLNYFYSIGDYVFNRVKTKSETYSRPTAGDDQVRNTAYTYDSNHLLSTQIQTSGNDTTGKFVKKEFKNRNSFGQSGRVELTATGEAMRFTETSYDTQGRYVVSTKQAGQLISRVITRDKYGNPTQIVNQQGITSYSSYDAFGGLYYQIDELGQWSQVTKTLGSGGYCTGTGAALYTTATSIGPTVWNCIDQLGRTVRTVNQGFSPSDVVYVDSHYDISGNLLEQSIPKFSPPSRFTANDWNRNAYDSLGRVQKSRNAKGDITTNSYSPLSVAVTNDLGRTTTTHTNMLGEIMTVQDANGNTITYSYDDKGNQTSIDGPLSGTIDKIMTYYDSFDNVERITDPNLGEWTYSYNLYGELQYQRDALNNCTVMTYDDLGRTTSRTYRTGGDDQCSTSVGMFESSTTWVYDNASSSASFGLLTQENNQKMMNTYIYDELGRLEMTVTKHLGEGIGGTDKIYLQSTYYDQYSRALASYDASEQSVRFEYNARGFQYKTIDQYSNTVYQQIMAIDAFGNVKQVKAGNDVTTSRVYDTLGRVTAIDTEYFGETIQNLNYVYDSVGNMKSRNDARDPSNIFYEEFAYDAVNRLDTVKAQNGSTALTQTMSFDYDEGGRITNFNGNSYNYTGNSVHGVDSISGNSSKTFIYDANGNQTNSDGRILVYSAFNKTTRMFNGGTSVDFVYGTDNKRIKRIDTGNDENETTYYVGNVEFITNNLTGTRKTKRYIGDTVITQYADNSQEVKYLHKDHLGSVQSVTSKNFATNSTQHLSFDAFGRRRDAGDNSTVLDGNPISDVTKRGYTGQEHIDQLGIINYNARLYDPSLGVMLQADTIIPDGPVTQSLNRYSYVFNNPLSYTDPTGNKPFKFFSTQTENAFAAADRSSQKEQGQGNDKQAENNKSVDAKIESPVGGMNNGSVENKQGNGLGGNSFNGEDLGEISNRYNGWDKPRKKYDVSFRTGPNIRQGKFGSHYVDPDYEPPTLWEATKATASFFDLTEAFRGCVSNGCGAGFWMLAATEFVPWGKLFGKIRFFKKGGGTNKDDFISEHSQKHMYNPNEISRPNKTQFGKNINVNALYKDTMLNPDSAFSTLNSRITKYSKKYDFNISTKDTPTGQMRVFINNPVPDKSTLFPFSPRD